MKKRTLKLLDEGLYALEKHKSNKENGHENTFDNLSIDLVDIKILRAGLKDPVLVDLDKWAKLFTALQRRGSELGESLKEIDNQVLLPALENYRLSAECHNLDDEHGADITINELQAVVNNEDSSYSAEEVDAANFLLNNPRLIGVSIGKSEKYVH